MTERIPCPRCGRPPVVCFCSHIETLATRTRLLLLQHPKERKVGIGTARLAHLSLPNSVLRVGVDFRGDRFVREALAAPAPVCVLFPKPGALDVSELPRDRPVTLVVLDGTWSLARKLLRFNPALAALPHVAFTPQRPSRYRIRRQPAEMCLSTIEALAEVLQMLEPENGPFDGLLRPFLAMVERQQRFVNEVGARRHNRRTRPLRPSRRQVLAARLADLWDRLVVVQGDSNAWPRRDPLHQPPEIVHWVAHRLASGETFEAVVAPRRTLAPSTPAQIELPEARILAGVDVIDWRRRWETFVRADDVVVTWGGFYNQLVEEEGIALPSERLDLRREMLQLLRTSSEAARGEPSLDDLRRHEGGRLRTVDACAAALGVGRLPLDVSGRAGRRLAALAAVATDLAGMTSPSSIPSVESPLSHSAWLRARPSDRTADRSRNERASFPLPEPRLVPRR